MTVVVQGRSLQKAYRNGSTLTPVLREIHLTIHQGECVFLVGPSGCGKTTLLSILGCILSPDAGQLELFGQNVSRLKSKHQSRFRRENVGFVFQRYHLFDGLNAWENVQVSMQLQGYSQRAGKREALQLLDAVGLADRANYQISQLSMGQRQRVALARALAGQPELILADEPTASLDAQAGQAAMGLLKQLCQERGKTVVVVTHDDRIFPLADRILTMSEGRLLSAQEDHEAQTPALAWADHLPATATSRAEASA